MSVRTITWNTQLFRNEDDTWHITIDGATIRDAYQIIHERADKRGYIAYSELMDELKLRGHRRINRRSIGYILGHISDQISIRTRPSIYPSAIVVHIGTTETGIGFWTLRQGLHPPHDIVDISQRRSKLDGYQKAVHNENWFLPST